MIRNCIGEWFFNAALELDCGQVFYLERNNTILKVYINWYMNFSETTFSKQRQTRKLLENTKYLVYISKNVAFSTTNERRSVNQQAL